MGNWEFIYILLGYQTKIPGTNILTTKIAEKIWNLSQLRIFREFEYHPKVRSDDFCHHKDNNGMELQLSKSDKWSEI